jgi:hypothetical protein
MVAHFADQQWRILSFRWRFYDGFNDGFLCHYVPGIQALCRL